MRAALDLLASERSADVIATFTEIESGKVNDRPELGKALHLAKVTDATLTIAKLDRLRLRRLVACGSAIPTGPPLSGGLQRAVWRYGRRLRPMPMHLPSSYSRCLPTSAHLTEFRVGRLVQQQSLLPDWSLI